jgi:arylsulfatase A-like enzyme
LFPRIPIRSICGAKPVADPRYLTDAFGDEAVAYIGCHKADPFFIYLAFNAPHVPLQATDKYLQRFPDLKGARRTYAAMVSAMDDAIDRVSEAIRTNALEEKTLIFFLSDNGGHPIANAAKNDPLRGEKGTVYEGGIRVPFVVKWTGRLPAGKTYAQPVVSLDIMATALAAAGAKPPKDAPLDGVNLVPHLRGEATTPPHETLYWRFIDHWAVRHGQWKLTAPAGGPEGFYDLSTDISESKDLSSANLEMIRKLKDLYAKWNSELPPVRSAPKRKGVP